MGLKTKPDCFDYVRRVYGVNPYKGQEVQHTITKRFGNVVESRSKQHYVWVRFEGQRHAMPCHPTELDYSGRLVR